jgi:hypothetical protein
LIAVLYRPASSDGKRPAFTPGSFRGKEQTNKPRRNFTASGFLKQYF